MRFQLMLATVLALSSATVAAQSAQAARMTIAIAPELDRQWPDLRQSIDASGVATVVATGMPAEFVLTTEKVEGDYLRLIPGVYAPPYATAFAFGRASDGDAGEALSKLLLLLDRQSRLIDVARRLPGDGIATCKVTQDEPDKCLSDGVVAYLGAMYSTRVHNGSKAPIYVGLVQLSWDMSIKPLRLGDGNTTTIVAPGKSLIIPVGADTTANNARAEIVLASDRPFETAGLAQGSPLGGSPACFVRVRSQCFGPPPQPMPVLDGLTGSLFIYAQESDPGPAMGGGADVGLGLADWMAEIYSTIPYTDEEVEADKAIPIGDRKFLSKRSPEERAHSCGGSVIAEDLILTAAHCVATGRFAVGGEGNVMKDRRVRVGSLRLGRGGVERSIVGVAIHANYTGEGSGIPFDIALLKIKNDGAFDLSQRILRVGVKIPAAGTVLTGLGWGYTGTVAPGANLLLSGGKVQHNPQSLQHAPLEVIPARECNPRVQGKWRPGMLCLVTPRKVVASGGLPTFSCRGDSGGPLVAGYGTDNEVQVGLTSWSLGCGYKGTPSVYTDVAFFARWIDAARREIKAGKVIRVKDPARAE